MSPLLEAAPGAVFDLRGAGAHDGTYTVAADGTGIARITHTTLFTHINGLGFSARGTPADLARRRAHQKPLAATVIRPASDVEIGAQLPHALRALAARQAAIHGNLHHLTGSFNRDVLRLGTDEQWQEAVSTALLSGWADSLQTDGTLTPTAVLLLRKEAQAIHRQLTPLWKRRTYGNKRVIPLETPVYNGATLRDLLADRNLPDGPLFDEIHDRRLVAVLAMLAPAEQDVFLAFGLPDVTTWAGAADAAGSVQPDKDGEKARRKVHRIVAELRRRDQQRVDGATGLWTPTHDGGAR
ncbi:hypothetical protein [Kitasatospora sp. NPDC101183]|uniref:hypothetical protein n=1 Tax=Kitasatospora sp. NPDC101183 TaxID=3364100 RepID=UPI0037F6BEF2